MKVLAAGILAILFAAGARAGTLGLIGSATWDGSVKYSAQFLGNSGLSLFMETCHAPGPQAWSGPPATFTVMSIADCTGGSVSYDGYTWKSDHFSDMPDIINMEITRTVQTTPDTHALACEPGPPVEGVWSEDCNVSVSGSFSAYPNSAFYHGQPLGPESISGTITGTGSALFAGATLKTWNFYEDDFGAASRITSTVPEPVGLLVFVCVVAALLIWRLPSPIK